MEIIKKTINLEQLKSHIPALVPYIRVEGFDKKEPTIASNVNGDFGGIMCDLAQNGEPTAALFDRYYKIKNILRGGEKYRKIVKGEDDVYYTNRIDGYVRASEFYPRNADDFTIVDDGLIKQFRMDDTEITIVESEDPETEDEIVYGGVYATEPYIRLLSDADYRKFKDLGGFATISRVEDMIGLVKVPSNITGSKVPETFYLSQIEPWLDWFNRNHSYKYTPISKFVYDNAKEEWKGTLTGGLPEKVLSEHPRYVDVVLTERTSTGLEVKHKYYRKIDAAPYDCCLLEEWNNRGGEEMWKFLKNKFGIYSQAIDLWAERMENGDVLIPTISVPILLTQNYDDNGVMSVYDEDIPYSGNQAGNGEPYTEGVGAESKLMSLRTREKLYSDEGEVLPYIGNGDIPFKVNECKNMSFDAANNTYIGDYIRKITYYDENNETSSTITNGYIEFEYVIGGPYDPGTSERISLDKGTMTTDCTEKQISGPRLSSSGGWMVISNSGSDWLTVSPESGGGGTTISFGVSENQTTEKRVATIIFGTTERSNYEEVVFSLIQLPTVTEVTASFAGSGPNIIEYGPYSGCTAGTGNSQQISETLTAIIKIKCEGSDWYVKSKPNFISLSINGGEIGNVYRVNVVCDPQESDESPARSGQIIFAAANDSTKTYTVNVNQSSEDVSGNGIFITPSAPFAIIDYGLGNEQSWNVYYDEAHTTPIPMNKYDVIVTDGNAALIRVVKSDGSFSITNINFTGKSAKVSLKIVNNSITTMDVSCGLALTIEPSPESVLPPIAIFAVTTTHTLEYYTTTYVNVTIKGGKSIMQSAWEVICDGEEEYVKITKMSDTRFSVKNLNTSDEYKEIRLSVKYTYTEEEVVSEPVTLLLKNQVNAMVTGRLRIHRKYDAYVKFDVWPKNGDPANAASVAGQLPNSFEPMWDPDTMCKDPNDTYRIRLTNPNHGYYPITHVELTDKNDWVFASFEMQYNQVYEFTHKIFDGNTATINIYVEP